jgi:hypothetical protein
VPVHFGEVVPPVVGASRLECIAESEDEVRIHLIIPAKPITQNGDCAGGLAEGGGP